MELNAKVIVDLINFNNGSNRVYSPLLHDYRTLLARLPQVRVAHVFREANKCMDLLARWGCSMQEEFTIFEPPLLFSVDFISLLTSDMYGVYFCRLASPTLVSVTS